MNYPTVHKHLEDLITEKYLQKVTQLDDPPEFTPEAINMIKYYLLPYLEELDNAQEFLSIINKYPQTLRDDIIRNAHYKDYYLVQPYDPWKIRKFILHHLISHIIFSDDSGMVFGGNDLIDPWEVELDFRFSKVPRELFHLIPLSDEENMDIIPTAIDVDVTINDRKFTHKMSQDLVLGIVIFYKAYCLSHPLSLYGEKSEFYYLTPRHTDIWNNYTIDLNGQTYTFYDNEFMRGLITAAQWNNIDPHQYITNLKQYKTTHKAEANPEVEIIELTF